MNRILRRPEVEHRTGHRRSTLYALIKAGVFPPPVAIGRRAVGWSENEVDAVNAARLRGERADAMRLLVSRLVEERSNVSAPPFLKAER